MKKEYEPVVDMVLTKQDAFRLIEELTTVSNELYHHNISVRDTISTVLSYPLSKVVIAILGEASNDQELLQRSQALIQKVKEELEKIPVITLTLAIYPTESTLKLIAVWLLTHIQNKVLLDIKVKPEIGGGVILYYQGQYRDYSILKDLQEKKESVTI